MFENTIVNVVWIQWDAVLFPINNKNKLITCMQTPNPLQKRDPVEMIRQSRPPFVKLLPSYREQWIIGFLRRIRK